MGDQGLGRVHLQLEGLSQEASQFGLDLLGLGLRPDETQENVIGITDVPQTPVIGVHRVFRGDGSHPLSQVAGFRPVAALLRQPPPVNQPAVFKAGLPGFPPGVLRYDFPLDEFVELVEVDVAEDG